MRKMLSFLPYWVFITLLVLLSKAANAQVPVPALGPQTFGTGAMTLNGWTIKKAGNFYYWMVVNSAYPSKGYTKPEASGDNQIVIFALSTPNDSLISPEIDCTNFTGGILKFGIWREISFKETLYVSLETGSGNSVLKYVISLPTDTILRETWRLVSIDLKEYIDHKSRVRIRFSPSSNLNDDGLLRIDDITLFGYTTTLTTDHFRTRTSGNWDNPATWESSRDSVYWMPSALSPTHLASSITLHNTHSVVNTSPVTVDQLTVKSGSTLTLDHDLILNDGRGEDVRIEEGGIIDLSTYQITGTGTVQLDGHLKASRPEGLYGSDATSITTKVLINTPGTNSVIEYNANTNQSISPFIVYNNLITSGSGDKTLAGPVIVSKDLQVNGGHLLLGSFDLAVGFTATGTPGSYIKITGSGKLTINDIGPESKKFPIGNTSYNPVTISSGSGLNWTVGIEDVWVSSDPGLAANWNRSVHRTWSITPSHNPPPLAAEVLLEYKDSDPKQVGTEFNKDAPVQVWRQAEAEWLGAGGTQKPIDLPSGTRSVTFSSNAFYSLFTISNLAAPLPIRFLNVSAWLIQSKVLITFTNAIENGLENYTLERSDDSQNYKPLEVIQPLKNDGTSVTYEVQDGAPLPALNFYRIKAKEKNGHITYSPVVRINSKETKPCLTVVPNPVRKIAVSVQLTNVPRGLYRVNLYNAKGQLLQHQSLQHAGGSTSFALPVERLAPGTYLIQLSGKEKLLQRFVIL